MCGTWTTIANPHAKALVRAGPEWPRAQKSRSLDDTRLLSLAPSALYLGGGEAPCSLTIPCDHFEKQPPHMSALNGSWSDASMDRRRDPESSDGANGARQIAQACSRSDRSCARDTVSDVIGLSSRSIVRSRWRGPVSRSGFEGSLVHSSDRFFLDPVIVTLALLPRRFARRSLAFIQ